MLFPYAKIKYFSIIKVLTTMWHNNEVRFHFKFNNKLLHSCFLDKSKQTKNVTAITQHTETIY